MKRSASEIKIARRKHFANAESKSKLFLGVFFEIFYGSLELDCVFFQ